MNIERQNLTVIYNTTNSCNMACKYCFEGQFEKNINQIKTDSNQYFVSVMDDLISFLEQVQKWNRSQKVNLILHGGEPLLINVCNYRKFFEELKKHGVRVETSIQTNGTLINAEVIELFKDYSIKVGISIDGDKELNDFQRVDRGGNGFFDRICAGIARCKNAGIPTGCVATITKKTLLNVKAFYEFFAINNLHYRFNPIFAGIVPAQDEKLYITAAEYGKFCIELFKYWVEDQTNLCEIANYEDIIRLFVGQVHIKGVCTNSENCYLGFVSVDANGDLYHCHRMCGNAKMRVGNIANMSLEDFMKDAVYMENRKEILQSGECGECSNWIFCHGGCPYNAFLKEGSFFSKDYFCDAYKITNEFIYNYLKKYECER